MIEPFKYLIQPVAIERAEDGRILREVPGETVSVYSAEQAAELIRGFEARLAEHNDPSLLEMKPRAVS